MQTHAWAQQATPSRSTLGFSLLSAAFNSLAGVHATVGSGTSVRFTTAPLVLIGDTVSMTTPVLTLTGQRIEMTTLSLTMTGQNLQMVTDRLTLTGNK